MRFAVGWGHAVGGEVNGGVAAGAGRRGRGAGRCGRYCAGCRAERGHWRDCPVVPGGGAAFAVVDCRGRRSRWRLRACRRGGPRGGMTAGWPSWSRRCSGPSRGWWTGRRGEPGRRRPEERARGDGGHHHRGARGRRVRQDHGGEAGPRRPAGTAQVPGRVYWVTLGRDVGKQALAGLVNGLVTQIQPDRAVTFTDARQAGEHLAAVVAAGPRRLRSLRGGNCPRRPGTCGSTCSAPGGPARLRSSLWTCAGSGRGWSCPGLARTRTWPGRHPPRGAPRPGPRAGRAPARSHRPAALADRHPLQQGQP